jgi:N6-L-threonylcarbamoyladenine synthase
MVKQKIILAIETTCDDTSIAIMANQKLLAMINKTTATKHAKYGGIVPEIAARGHEQNLLSCFNQALKKAKIHHQTITHVAYASEPGLPGSLHVGKIWAKAMAYLMHAKLIEVNHIIAHMFAFAINRNLPINYPFIGLVVSGGHTSIYLFNSANQYKLLTHTNDDAVGETLDKIGRILKLPYPGGIAIDNIFNSNQNNLTLIQHTKPIDPFSFSGIKTHISNYCNNTKNKKHSLSKVIIASSVLQ